MHPPQDPEGHPDGVTVAPNWCSFDNRAINEPPTSVHEPLTRVTIRAPRGRYVEVLRAVQAARPDLVLSI
ncbi:hypothetical protein [Nocardiopsis sp. NPDC006832]|uniref:hypothetical protein n=1 Tax=Nocardiopsis sp. NPDC006832 TaxID=3157188 RepID=UPI0033FE1E0C